MLVSPFGTTQWNIRRRHGVVSSAELEARMIVVQVSLRAKPEHAEQLEQILREVVGEARRLEGCTRYEWYRSPDVDRGAFVYAEFDSEEAFADYRTGPVVKKIVEQLIPMLEAPPSYKHFSATLLQQR
jgi:quinol monooxygenase YgiN